MKNSLIILLLAVFVISSCKKEDTETGADSKNSMRVARIVGHNEAWGDFTYKIYYKNNKIDSAYRYDENDRKRGEISASKVDGVLTYNVSDYVVAIDADSITRMDAALKAKYGEGNYSLEDSIPRNSRIRYSVKLKINEGLVARQTIAYNKPRENLGSGNQFNNNYLKEKQEIAIYEYNDLNQVVNRRMFVDIFDLNDQKISTRKAYKSEYLFDGKKISKRNNYVLNNEIEESWESLITLNYVYSGNNISSISGSNHQMEIAYSERYPSAITLNGATTTYKFNANGYVTRIDYGNGNFMEMEYESGLGDFNLLLKVDTPQEGFPVIR